MLHVVKDLERLKIDAIDGDIGYVYDFYFDDVTWTTRYLVADTGKWLTGRRVLLSPNSVEKPDFKEKELSVNLKREQIESSPSISEDEPVSLQHEKLLGDYYDWPAYWSMDPALQSMFAMKDDEHNKDVSSGDPHLRSIREVRSYDVEALDGDIGVVDSFIIDDNNWNIKYLVIDTRKWLHWLPGGKFVLISPKWIDKVDYQSSKIFLSVDKKTVEEIPEFEHAKDIDMKFENKLYDCYRAFLNRKQEHTPR
ncbi:MAG: PRC-barrel domain containing protein [Ignavibacteriae bacterium]|jgi:hypothetical protein|nr:PRC-barrel domain containing protein [Ignavibacteriota bacterium]NOG97934.1 PRC-barrel domain containing protein [Ignavibacteriota bacterium]